MDFSKFYTEQHVFSIGYDTIEERLAPYNYNKFASESRILSFISIVKGDVPSKHWLCLDKTLTKYKTRKEFSKGSPSAYTTAYKKGILSSLKLIDEHPAKRPIRNIETGEIFPSLSAAGKKYGISPDYISLAARGKRDSYAGFHWEFVENE